MGYRIRVGEAADKQEHIEHLRERTPEVSLESEIRRYEWMHEKNPHGKAIAFLAIDDDTQRIVGCSSVFPRVLVDGDRKIRALFGGDAYVKPAYRRQGISEAIFRYCRMNVLGKGTYDVLFAMLQPMNNNAAKKGGAVPLHLLQRYARPLSARALKIPGGRAADAAFRLLSRSRYRLDEAAPGDGRFDEVWEASRRELGLTTQRDAAFMTWRFQEGPTRAQKPYIVTRNGKAYAACALEQVGSVMHVIDFVAPRRHWGKAFRAIAQHAKHADRLEIYFSDDLAKKALFWRHGFLRRPEHRDFVLMQADAKRAFDGADRWYVTLAENDHDDTPA